MKQFAISSMRVAMIILFSLVILGSPSNAQVVQEWLSWYTSNGFLDVLCGIGLDSTGFIYAAGYCDYDIGQDNFTGIKYDSLGNEQWVVIYDAPASRVDRAFAMTVDASGNLYMTGESKRLDGNYDIATVKYSTEGLLLWEDRYGELLGNGPGMCAKAIAIDNSGNVLVTGKADGVFSVNRDFITVKYESTGNRLWAAHYICYSSPDGSGGKGLVVDGEDNIYVVGESQANITIIKYSPDGEQSWIHILNDPGYYYGQPSIAIDEENFVYVTASKNSELCHYISTVKYDSSGTRIWSELYSGQGIFNIIPSKIAVAPDGNIVIVGKSALTYSPSSQDYLILKYAPDGTLLWSKTFDGKNHLSDETTSVTFDSNNNIYVAGNTSINLTGGYDKYMVVKYNSSGEFIWVASEEPSGFLNISTKGICVGNDNKVYLGGWGSHWDTQCLKQSEGISVSIEPVSPPVQLPPLGGSFEFQARINNVSPTSWSLQGWFEVMTPDTTYFEPLDNAVCRTVEADSSIHSNWTLFVPEKGPPGTYVLTAFVGDYESSIWSVDSFEFEKLVTGEGTTVKEWAMIPQNIIESKGGEVFPGSHKSIAFNPPSPNPFNPSTVLGYKLQAASRVSLTVYDISGREVAELVDGWKNVGTHEVVFDGTGLASGVYVYRLEAGGATVQGKMVLMK